MLVKHFRSFGHRVPDPMRPGRTATVMRLRASHSVDPLSYTDEATGDEVEVLPDADGWYDVPQEVGERLCRFRDKGSGLYEKGQVEEEERLGNIDSAEPAPPPRRRPSRQKAPEENTLEVDTSDSED